MLKTIFIMPNKETDPDATMMIVVDEVTPETNPKTYQYVYVGNINDLPSDVLTESSLVDIPGTNYDFAMSQKGTTDLVSEYNISTNNNNAEYTFAQAVALVPASLQKGGLTIKYIDSTTHKYTIKRLMSSTWNTTESNWVDVNTFASGQEIHNVVIKNIDGSNSNSNGVLSVDSGVELNNRLFGGNITVSETSAAVDLTKGYYNTKSAVVGNYYAPTPVVPYPNKTYRCKKITVHPGETYIAVHKAGTTAYVKSYVKTDLDDLVTEIGIYQSSPAAITEVFTNETDTAYNLYLNFYTSIENDWTGQSLTKITTEYTGGVINELKAKTQYAVCETLGDVSAKEVAINNYVLETDVRLLIKFTHTNTAESSTLNINNTGEKSIVLNNSVISADNTWEDGDVLDVYYDGTNYQCRVVGSAEGVEELRDEIFGVRTQNTEDITSTLSGGYYRTYSTTTVGSVYVGTIATSATIRKNFKCKKVTVNVGETYIAVHKAGTTAAALRYVKVDKNDVVLDVAGIGSTLTTDIFAATRETGAFTLYLNFYTSTENDWTGQSLTKITTEYTGGAINELREDTAQEILDSKVLSGKTILCLGDSITEFQGNDGKRYSDWLAEISNATVINGGFGGSQYRRHANASGYGGMDVISVVKAITSGAFPSTPTVGVMQYEGTSEDRLLDEVTNVEVGTKTTDESTRYPDHTKLNVTINDITFSLMVYTYTLDGTTLYYNSDYAGYLTTNEWKTLIVSAENVKFTSNDDNRAIVRRLEEVNFSQLYAITLFAGTNDWNVGDASSVGVSGTESDTTTLGAIDRIIRLLNESYPNVRLYFFTPIVRYRGSSNTDENWCDNYIAPTGMNLRDFSALIFNEVQLYHIPVFDMYNTLGWNRYNFDNFFNSTDGTHPRKGFKWIAETMYRFLISGSNTFGVDNMLAKEVETNRTSIQLNTQNITDIIGFLDVQFPGWNND